MSQESTTQTHESPAKPPIFSTWSRMYLFVLVLHALVIAALYLLTLNYR